MPQVLVEKEIDQTIDQVWKVVSDIETYPKFMSSVKEVKILEDKGKKVRSHWKILLDESEMQWTEEETKMPEVYRINFNQIDGDLAKFEGHWQLDAINSGTTKVSLKVDFDIGIPPLEDILNPVASDALRDNSLRMLNSIHDQTKACK